MRIDSHQHFWRYDPADYPWIKSEWPIRRDFLPSDLQPLLEQHSFEGCIAVQARQTLEESRWLLQLADKFPQIKGVVGWVDLRSSTVAKQLAELAVHKRFVGIRHVVQDEPDDRFLLQPDFLRGISRLKQFDLTYDLLLYPRQLPAAVELVKRFPDQPFVLDHVGKPPVHERTLSPWREHIRELAQSPNVFCKISGLVTEADWATSGSGAPMTAAAINPWQAIDFTPYLDIAFEYFGEDRIMYGSDWPVCLLAESYEKVFKLVDDYAQQLGTKGRAKFFGGNAARFYSRAATRPSE